MNDFDTTIDRIRQEKDPAVRSGVEQFIVETVRTLSNLTTKQAASLSIQLLATHQFAGSAPTDPELKTLSFEALSALVADVDVRSDSEWRSFGFRPTATARPLLIAIPRVELCYRHTDVEPANPEATAPDRRENQELWRQRMGTVTEPNPIYTEFAGEGVPERALTMLGNLWKIGVVVTRDTESRLGVCNLVATPVQGETPFPLMSEHDCWYHIQVSPGLGGNQIPEITRCLAEIFCGYLPQLWAATQVPAGKLRIQESEAAAYIALERLGLPARKGNTTWTNSYISHHPLSPAFRWDIVLEASHQIENLLRGDTRPVSVP